MRLAARLLCVFFPILTSCISTSQPKGDNPLRVAELALEGSGVIVIGDQGVGDSSQRQVGNSIAAYCLKAVCDFGLTVGDNFYPAGVKSKTDSLWQTAFEIPYKNLSPDFKFYASLGNHDYAGSWQAQVDYKSPRWAMPYRYYKISTPKADIWVLDTNFFDTKYQRPWLEAGLAASRKKWKVLVGHHPLFSSGPHGATKQLQELIAPLLTKYGITTILAGHDHHLELIQKGSVAHVISGAAGKTRSVTPGRDSVFAKGELGFAHMYFTDEGMELSFIDKNAKTIYAVTYNEPAN